MHPLLFQLGIFKLHTYGLMIVIGFLTGLHLIQRQAQKEGIDPNKIVDLSFWALGLGLLGGRIIYIFTRLDYFAQRPLEIFYFWEGGLVFYGGFLGGLFAFWHFGKKFKLPLLKTIDLGVPSLAIAHFFGRIGCFFAGCCYGRPASHDLPWAVIFPPESLAQAGVPLHPAQLYDALNALIVFSILMWVQKHKKFGGQVLLVYMMLYSIGRSIVETYRGDSIRGFVIEGWLSTSQFISIFVFIAAIILWRRWSKENALAPKTSKKS